MPLTLPTACSIAALLLAAASAAHAAPLPPELLGTWELSEAAADLVAPNCRSMTYRFEPASVTWTSGEMVLSTRVDVDPDAPAVAIRQVVSAFNLRPNCIGTLTPYALGQRIADLRVSVHGDRLRLHLLERRGGAPHVELVRSSRPAAVPAATSGPARPTVNMVFRADPAAAPQCPDLSYPEAAERDGAQGVTRLRFTVDRRGMAVQPQITHGAGMTRAHRLLDRAAAEALVRCEFALDKATPGNVMLVEHIWRLPGSVRPASP